MLSSFGQRAIRLSSLSSHTINHRVDSVSLLCLRVAGTGIGHYTPRCITRTSLQRSFATKPVSRPKAHTGRTTSSPRKAKPTTKSEPTETSPDDLIQKKAKPTAKAKANSTRKPKSKPKTKTKAKAKTKPKPRKARVAKQPQNEEQKAAAVESARRSKIRFLRKAALKPPAATSTTGWAALTTEMLRGNTNTPLASTMKEAAQRYKNLSLEEREHYNHIANQNHTQALKIYRDWIESHSIDEIRKANNARFQLKRVGVKISKLQDTRQIKRPVPALFYFNTERRATGDYKGMEFSEATKLISKEYKELPQGERKKFDDLAVQDKERYNREKDAQAA